MVTALRCIFFIFILSRNVDSAASAFESSKWSEAMKDYNVFQRPDEDSPTNVTISAFILSLGGFDMDKMEYNVVMYFRQFWVDPRLAKSLGNEEVILLPHRLLDQIWIPDTFFAHKKEGETSPLNIPEKMIRIDTASGQVMMSIRVTLTKHCSFELSRFPFDSHSCELSVESYGFTDDEISYQASSDIRIDDNFHSSQFTLVSHSTKKVKVMTATGTYSRLIIVFTFKRISDFYIIQMIIPSIMLVIFSWLSFWLHPTNNVTSRLLIPIGGLIILVILMISARITIKISSVTIHDSWSIACFMFISLTCLQILLVHWLMRVCEKKVSKVQENQDETEVEAPFIKRVFANVTDSIVDRISRILFPIVFILFTIIFWAMKSNPNDK